MIDHSIVKRTRYRTNISLIEDEQEEIDKSSICSDETQTFGNEGEEIEDVNSKLYKVRMSF